MDSRRAEAFSDGVFAVAITVLVFGLRLPGGGSNHSPVTSQLLRAWPQYAAYVVSFLTIGIMWMNHHTIFGHISRIDRRLLVLNLLLLMGVVAIPFPTALVADHLHDAGGTAAAVTYGLVMIAISCGFTAIWIYIGAHPRELGAPAITRESFRTSAPRFTVGPLVYAAGTLVAAFLSAAAAVAIYGLLAVYYLFEHLPSPGGEPGQPGE